MKKEKKLDHSVIARFGEEITKEKWGVVPFSIYLYQKELGLKIHVWFLIWLIVHKWTEKKPFPSIAKLSRISGYSVSHVRDISRKLQKKGYIKVEPRFREDGGRNTNMYDLEPLFEMIRGMIGNENTHKEQKAQVPKEKNLPEELAVEYHTEDSFGDDKEEDTRMDKLEGSIDMQQAIEKTRKKFEDKLEKNNIDFKELVVSEE